MKISDTHRQSGFQQFTLTFAAASISSVLSFQVLAADIRPHILSSYRAIVIEGKIELGDFETFKRIVQENNGRVSDVYCFSPGGDFYEAMKIGRAMRALKLNSIAPLRSQSGQPTCRDPAFKPRDAKNCTCASAGFFLHIGATYRGGTYLAVHRPYFEKGRFENLSEAAAKRAFDALQNSARVYMSEMGVPQHVQEDILGIPSNKILTLDERVVRTYFLGALPYHHEWITNKCTRLSGSEEQRMRAYSERLLAARTAADANLTKQEWADLDILQRKEGEQRKCQISIMQKSRIDAYEKYFQAKASDFANQDFSRWSEAVKYLGRHFYEISSEEKFEEEAEFRPVLKRAATATAPLVLLFGSLATPRVVASVSLISSSNPSPEYVLHLVKSLESAWGKPSGGDVITEWRWVKREYVAVLKKDKAAEGPFLSLKIESPY